MTQIEAVAAASVFRICILVRQEIVLGRILFELLPIDGEWTPRVRVRAAPFKTGSPPRRTRAFGDSEVGVFYIYLNY